MKIKPSELILNEDGSVYHLNLKPGEVSKTIITVGDQERASLVASYFDKIDVERQKREFKTITGIYQGKSLTVISTGIGTDNIDIVFTELDALFNVDTENRRLKNQVEVLNFIRLGTSGAIPPELGVDKLLISIGAIGMDNLLNFYEYAQSDDLQFLESLADKTMAPYYAAGDASLIHHFTADTIKKGITITANGFYGPQRRSIRLKPTENPWFERIKEFKKDGYSVSNLEMETAGIYAMSRLLGHRAISINALLANRSSGSFSKNPSDMEKKMIEWALEKISLLP